MDIIFGGRTAGGTWVEGPGIYCKTYWDEGGVRHDDIYILSTTPSGGEIRHGLLQEGTIRVQIAEGRWCSIKDIAAFMGNEWEKEDPIKRNPVQISGKSEGCTKESPVADADPIRLLELELIGRMNRLIDNCSILCQGKAMDILVSARLSIIGCSDVFSKRGISAVRDMLDKSVEGIVKMRGQAVILGWRGLENRLDEILLHINVMLRKMQEKKDAGK